MSSITGRIERTYEGLCNMTYEMSRKSTIMKTIDQGLLVICDRVNIEVTRPRRWGVILAAAVGIVLFSAMSSLFFGHCNANFMWTAYSLVLVSMAVVGIFFLVGTMTRSERMQEIERRTQERTALAIEAKREKSERKAAEKRQREQFRALERQTEKLVKESIEGPEPYAFLRAPICCE